MKLLITLTSLVVLLVLPGSSVFADSCCGLAKKTTVDIPGPIERVMEIEYRFNINDLAENSKQAFAWIPVPRSNERQHLADYKVSGDWDYEIVQEPEYGNRYLKFDLSNNKTSDISIGVTYDVRRYKYQPLANSTGMHKLDSKVRHRLLSADRMVPIDGVIAKEAKTVAGREKDTISKVQRLYENIVKTVKYDKTGQGWGRGDAVYACDVRAGNCTDFHSLFIGETRSLGIPSRFIMGIPVPEGKSGEIKGYHCWAEFFDETKGWIPVDASEASKNPELQEALFGGLDANRVEFTFGRDIQLPGAASQALNYSFYPHVEVNGQIHDDIKTGFTFKELPVNTKNKFACGMANGCGTGMCDAASCSMMVSPAYKKAHSKNEMNEHKCGTGIQGACPMR